MLFPSHFVHLQPKLSAHLQPPAHPEKSVEHVAEDEQDDLCEQFSCGVEKVVQPYCLQPHLMAPRLGPE